MKLAYEAYDRAGKKTSSVIDAADASEATDALRRQGLYVTQIAASNWSAEDAQFKSRGLSLSLPGFLAGKKMSRGRALKHLVSFSRQLHVLVSTGTPLVQALETLERQANDPLWRKVVGELRAKVEEGGTLSGAMAEEPDYFNAVCRSLIAAGESSGKLSAMLQRLSVLTRKQQHIRSTILGAMVYPSLLVAVSLIVSVVMVIFVLPRFAEMFKTMGMPLPGTTAVLMAVSDWAREYWYLLPVLGGGFFVGLRWWLKTRSGIVAMHTLMLRLPQIGKVSRSFITARITRLMGMLLDSYLPLLEVLQLTRDSITNTHYRNLLARAEKAVTHGEPISSAFNHPQLIHPSIYEAIKSGESSGNIGPLMLNMSDFLDEDNEVILKSLSSIIEPLILIVLGGIIGLVAVSIFLPLFDMTSMTGSSGGAP